jgi:hypothetical protein
MRRFRLFLLLLSAALLCTACGSKTPPPPAAEVLSGMLSVMKSTAQPLPDGITRLSSAPANSPDCLTETFFSALYGEAARGLLVGDSTESPPITDAALFLSLSPYPCELGVFRCVDESAAGTVAGLCRGRLDTLARGFKGSEWESAAAGGQVGVEGNYVLLVLCEDPAPALKAARRLVKGA